MQRFLLTCMNSITSNLTLAGLLFSDHTTNLLSNSSLSLVRLGVDFVLPLSQEQQQEEQEPPPKISAVTDRNLMKL